MLSTWAKVKLNLFVCSSFDSYSWAPSTWASKEAIDSGRSLLGRDIKLLFRDLFDQLATSVSSCRASPASTPRPPMAELQRGLYDPRWTAASRHLVRQAFKDSPRSPTSSSFAVLTAIALCSVWREQKISQVRTTLVTKRCVGFCCTNARNLWQLADDARIARIAA